MITNIQLVDILTKLEDYRNQVRNIHWTYLHGHFLHEFTDEIYSSMKTYIDNISEIQQGIMGERCQQDSMYLKPSGVFENIQLIELLDSLNQDLIDWRKLAKEDEDIEIGLIIEIEDFIRSVNRWMYLSLLK